MKPKIMIFNRVFFNLVIIDTKITYTSHNNKHLKILLSSDPLQIQSQSVLTINFAVNRRVHADLLFEKK